MHLDRATLGYLWSQSWEKGHGYTPWKDALGDLTPAQAAWKPGPERHSIWAHASHVAFWREYLVAMARGQSLPSDAEVANRSFDAPKGPSDASLPAWAALQTRVEQSHRLVERAIQDATLQVEPFAGLVAHDAYHLGQIMLLRAMLGLKPLM